MRSFFFCLWSCWHWFFWCRFFSCNPMFWCAGLMYHLNSAGKLGKFSEMSLFQWCLPREGCQSVTGWKKQCLTSAWVWSSYCHCLQTCAPVFRHLILLYSHVCNQYGTYVFMLLHFTVESLFPTFQQQHIRDEEKQLQGDFSHCLKWEAMLAKQLKCLGCH